jgi:hypothetical protein
MVVRAGHRLVARKHCHIFDVARQIDEISLAETTVTPAAVYPDGALEKVTGLSPWRTWPRELELINGGPDNHAATRAFIVDDVIVSGPFIYKGAAKHFAGYGKAGLWDRSGAQTVDMAEAVLVSCISGSAFFGPFLKDSLPQELLPDDGAQKIVLQTKPYSHEAGYRALFDLPAPPLVQRARIGQLTFYEDHGQNASRGARYRMLHDRLHAHVGQNDGRSPVGVYLKRGATGETRVLTNEGALEAFLAGIGFDIVEPAVLSADEIARRTLDAPIVISVEGSHISHVVYSMLDTGTLLVLQPPDRFAMAFKEFTDRFGIRFAFVVGQQAEGGFAVDLDEMQRLMERLA